MKKILFLTLFLSFCLSRENPFMPTGELNTSVVTTNVIETLSPFEKQHIKFPSDTKDFISITLKYKNLDGSVKEKVIDINKSVDWQDELILMKMAAPSVVVKPDVSVTKDEPKIAMKPIKSDSNTTSQITQEMPQEGNLTKQEPLKDVVIVPVETGERKEPFKSIKFKKAVFEFDLMQIKILTSDVKIRDFMVDKDRKIVIDFKSSSNFYTKTFKLDCGAFKSMVFGAHDKFYRAVVNLDGKYKYDIGSAAPPTA